MGRDDSVYGAAGDWAGILWEKRLCSERDEVVLVREHVGVGEGGVSPAAWCKSQLHPLLLHLCASHLNSISLSFSSV